MVRKRRSASSEQDESNNLTSNVRRTALSLAVAAALPSAMAMPMTAYAQDEASDEVIEEIITYGSFRQSLINSITTKRDSSKIVEAISAEDIGKLPDSSIAETLARLPGLAGERRNGRTSGISVRGFREEYVGVTMNGRELLGMGDNRGVEYDLYPSEIVSGVVVYKTPDATLTTQGIGGVVDLRTTRPLDAAPHIVANINLEQNDLSSGNPDFDDNGHRLALSFSDVFADDTIGLALAVATTESPNQEEHFRGWGYPSEGNGDAILGGHDSYVRSAMLERDTISGVLQFAPSDDLTITFDALYIDFSEEEAKRGLEEGGAQWGTGNYTVTGNDNGLVTDGYYDDFRSVIRNDGRRQDAELTTFGVNFDYQMNDDWVLKADLAHSKVDKTITDVEAYAGVGRPGTGTQGPATGRSWTMTPNGAVYSDHPTIAPVDLADFNTIRLAGPQAWGGGLSQVAAFQADPLGAFPNVGPSEAQDGFVNEPIFDEELTTLRLEAARPIELGILTQVEFGIYYSDRSKSKDNDGYFLTAPTWPSDGLIPEEYRLGTTSLGFIGIDGVVAFDGIGMYDSGFFTRTDAALLQPDRLGDTYTIDEELISVFAKVDFDTEIGDIVVNGNFGLQVISTDQSASGFDSFIGPSLFVEAVTSSDGDDYTDVLPSLNVNFEIADNHVVRTGLSTTISRPRMDQMKVNNNVSFNFNLLNIQSTDPLNSSWSGNAGNSKLKPLEANQFDLAYDWYYANDGFVSAAFFYKDLTNWHRNGNFIADFTDLYIPGYHQVVDTDGTVFTPATQLGLVSFTEDGLEGFVRGYELQANYPFHMMTDALDGLGIIASAAFNDGKLDDGQPVPGLSEETYQMTIYYERGGFQARVSGTKRDKFSTEVRGLSLALQQTFDQGAELIDAQISYDFGLGGFDRLDGLSISLQGQNLTDEGTIQTNNDARQVTQAQAFGANYLLGVNYKFQ
jgi:iron complex outermembrane receptor protein